MFQPIGETRRSKSNIGTQYLGPCLGFLLTFQFYGAQYAILMHYTNYIEKAKLNNGGHIGQLIRLIEFIIEETEDFFLNLIVDSKLCLSELNLIVAGGDELFAKPIHDGLSLLNRKLQFPIKLMCKDECNVCSIMHYLTMSQYSERCQKCCLPTTNWKKMIAKQQLKMKKRS